MADFFDRLDKYMEYSGLMIINSLYLLSYQ